MTTREELVGNLPLQYFDGPDYCTVKDATGGDFALTVQPDLMKLMEDALASRQEVSVTVPRVTDNDRDEITVTLDGKELRGWSYASDQERRTKMLCAREYVEGFFTGRQS